MSAGITASECVYLQNNETTWRENAFQTQKLKHNIFKGILKSYLYFFT